MTTINESETQQETMLQDDDSQDIQPDEKAQDEVLVPLCPDPPEHDRQQG